ncbi:MAG: PilT/PilU family type 4a pilus ATPase [Gammaproteobacteria bacterium]
MEFFEYLRILAVKDGSDLYLTTGAPPTGKFHGVLKALDKEIMRPGQVKEIANSIMTDAQARDFGSKPEMNLALAIEKIGRFRVNIYKQRTEVAMVVRNIKTKIPDADDLGLPPILKDVIMEKRGLVLFVGATGSGKSTSLAALLDHRNRNSSGHIITLEDPIEFLHSHRRCIVSQREIGVDTDSYEDALKNTLRQAPDVILMGEIRDQDTMEYAMVFSETGHLAISTLHANNANQQLLLDLSLNLKAIVSQRLVKTIDGKRTAAFEILLGTPLVRDLIKKGEVAQLKDIMEKSEPLGMQTFDAALFKLFQEGRISEKEALRNADSPNNLRLRISLAQRGGGSLGDDSMTLEEIVDEEEAGEGLIGLSR